jgi:hypothetical protein
MSPARCAGHGFCIHLSLLLLCICSVHSSWQHSTHRSEPYLAAKFCIAPMQPRMGYRPPKHLKGRDTGREQVSGPTLPPKPFEGTETAQSANELSSLQRVHEIGLARLYGRRRWHKEKSRTGVSPAVRLGLHLPPPPSPPPPPPAILSEEFRQQRDAERAAEVRFRARIELQRERPEALLGRNASSELELQLEAERQVTGRMRAKLAARVVALSSARVRSKLSQQPGQSQPTDKHA